MKRIALSTLALCLCLAVAGCAKHTPQSGGGHTHTAPHGGTLVELGEHAYNLELVRDAAEGKLTAYVLDGHAENFIRIPAPGFELIANVGGDKKPLTMRAVANNITGEAFGNTSQFEAQADWLKTTAEFSGTISSVEIRGSKFSNVTFRFPKH